MGLFSFLSELVSDSPKAQPIAPEPSAPSIADIDPFYGSDRFVNGTENLGQYMEYLHSMEEVDLGVMSEFLVMAAALLDIKCRIFFIRSDIN